MSSISSLPDELSTMIFCDYLDQKDQIGCLQVNKKISELVSARLLSNLGLSATSTPITQLFSYYKKHCDFFSKKIPTLLNGCRTTTVFETKQKIDHKLSLPVDVDASPNAKSLLDESWSRFVLKIRPSCSGRCPYELPLDKRFNDSLILDTADHEVQMFVRAGASEAKLVCVFETIIEQSWCSEATVQTLLSHNFKVDTDIIISAFQSNKFKHFVPVLIGKCSVNSLSLSWLFGFMPPDYEQKLEQNYIDKFGTLIKVKTDDILDAIENKYSEKMISKLLKNCAQVDAYIVRLAIEGTYSKFSENFIRELVEKCPSTLTSYHIHQAIGKYSQNLIEKIYNKIDPTKACKFSARTVEYTFCKYTKEGSKELYDENMMEFLVSHIEQDQLVECLESLIKYCPAHPYQAIVEKYLPPAPINFSRYVFHHLILNGYSEDFIQKIHEITAPESTGAVEIKDLMLALPNKTFGEIMDLYSPKVIDIFLNGEIEIDATHIQKALEKEYPEEMLIKLMDRATHVNLIDLKKAKQKPYSQELISKMAAKCEEQEGCVLQ